MLYFGGRGIGAGGGGGWGEELCGNVPVKNTLSQISLTFFLPPPQSPTLFVKNNANRFLFHKVNLPISIHDGRSFYAALCLSGAVGSAMNPHYGGLVLLTVGF